eukprot:NODE_1901_length_1039_cov_81.414141_g1545_i0.p1 GENE.NODE_1901_length_1039_cov_81.414141_g1545_i0~~NODE_1901_length_1039_cov_81.414141_g1545_i0.p1  ORF type:complete len:157 (+),score=7.42 NODE_1901_length_1039_cov_81.414141_g1545_i0:436-906(+)
MVEPGAGPDDSAESSRFMSNGGCGYLLKPGFLRQKSRQPPQFTLVIRIIRGLEIPLSESSVCIAVMDGNGTQRSRTRAAQGIWNQEFSFVLSQVELAVLSIGVEAGGRRAEANLPCSSLRCGYRSAPVHWRVPAGQDPDSQQSKPRVFCYIHLHKS